MRRARGKRPHVMIVSNAGGGANPFLFTNFSATFLDELSTSDMEIWKALRATSAAPAFFESIELGKTLRLHMMNCLRLDVLIRSQPASHVWVVLPTEWPGSLGRVTFVDGGVGWNNPTKILDRVLCGPPFNWQPSEKLTVVSLGMGLPLFRPFNDKSVTQLITLIRDTATECDNTHKHVYDVYKSRKEVKYMRFSPDGLGEFKMDDGSVEVVNNMLQTMTNWLGDGTRVDLLQELASLLTTAPEVDQARELDPELTSC
jgi:hypothetical protein